MNVLSLYDGIACGRIALERVGIKVDKYYASEIDKNAIKIATTNYPDIIEIGDIREVDINNLPRIDLLIGGSPCTNLSASGKCNGMITIAKEKITSLNRYLELKNKGVQFEGQSYLFWEYVRVLKKIQKTNPNVLFLLENVIMVNEWERIITDTLGVRPVKINSALVSAQNRVRLYWTNVPFDRDIKDKAVTLSDILENTEWLHPAAIRGRYVSEISLGDIELRGNNVKIIQCLEVRKTNTDKSNCLTTVEKDNVLTPLPIGRHPDAYGMISGKPLPFRVYTRREYERLQTLPDGYTDCVSESVAKKCIGNGWTVDIITHIFGGMVNG